MTKIIDLVRIEASDYCGTVDCKLVSGDLDRMSIFKGGTEKIYVHPDWNFSVCVESSRN